MFEVYALLFVCTILATICNRNMSRVNSDLPVTNYTRTGGNSFALIMLILIMIWFSGTRTHMNDTGTYLNSYRLKIPSTLEGLRSISWTLGDNPLFSVYEILLKTFVSENPQVFILTSATITIVLMVMFLYRYAWRFGQSLYLFIAFTVFGFTMAAIKQTLATSIAIWVLACIPKRKYISAIILMSVAVLIHPYVIIILIAGALYNKSIWSPTVFIIVGATVIIGITFSAFTSLVFRMTSLIGLDYEENWDIARSGVGIARVMAYAITPGLAFVYRDKLRRNPNPFYDMCVSMSIVALCLSVISSFGGAVLFGRLPSYFGLTICIALPYVLDVAIEDEVPTRTNTYLKTSTTGSLNILPFIVLGMYIFYYATYYNKFFVSYNVGFWDSIYKRVSIFSIFSGG